MLDWFFQIKNKKERKKSRIVTTGTKKTNTNKKPTTLGNY